MRTDPDLAEAIEECQAEWDPAEPTATARFDALLERWPDDPVALVAVGEAHDEVDGSDAAIRCYEQALKGLDGADLRRCFLRLGDALRRAGRVPEATEVFERGLDEFPGSRSLRTFLALALHEQGRSDAALGLLLEVLVDPMPSPDLALFTPAVKLRAKDLFARDRVA